MLVLPLFHFVMRLCIWRLYQCLSWHSHLDRKCPPPASSVTARGHLLLLSCEPAKGYFGPNQLMRTTYRNQGQKYMRIRIWNGGSIVRRISSLYQSKGSYVFMSLRSDTLKYCYCLLFCLYIAIVVLFGSYTTFRAKTNFG